MMRSDQYSLICVGQCQPIAYCQQSVPRIMLDAQPTLRRECRERERVESRGGERRWRKKSLEMNKEQQQREEDED